MIEQLSFTNVKGRNLTLELAPLTILTGENHAGKTAVLDALTIGTVGYHPRLGKSNPATFRLSSGDEMSVSLAGNKWTTTRTWKQRGKSVKRTDATSLGAPTFTPSLMEPETFLAAKPKERLELLAAIASSDDSALRAKVREWEGKLGTSKAETPIEAMEFLEEVARLKAAEKREVARRYVGTVQGGNELSDVASMADMTAAHEAALAESQRLGRMVTEAVDRARELEAASEAAADAQTELAGMTQTEYRDPRELEAASESAFAAHMRAVQLRGDANSSVNTLAAEVARLRRKIGLPDDNVEFTVMLQSVESELAAAQALQTVDVDALRKALRHACDIESQAGAKLVMAAAAISAADESIRNIEQQTCCPVCLASAEGWREAVIASTQKARAFQTTLWQNCDAEGRAAAAEVTRLTGEISRAEQNHRVILRIPELQERAEAIQSYRRAIADLRRIQDERDKLVAAAEEAAAAAAAAAEAVKANNAALGASQRLKELAAIIHAAPSAAKMTEAENAAELLKDLHTAALVSVGEVSAKRDAAAEAEGQRQLILKAQAALEEAEAEAEQFSALQKEIRACREEAVLSGYKPIMERAAIFGAGIIEGHLGVNDGEIGILRGANFVPVECMSGTERVVVTASIQAALSALAGGVVIVDEASRMSRKNRVRFAENLVAAIARGEVMQAIMVDHDAPAWDGWQDQSKTLVVDIKA